MKEGIEMKIYFIPLMPYEDRNSDGRLSNSWTSIAEMGVKLENKFVQLASIFDCYLTVCKCDVYGWFAVSRNQK